jgi:hypothetical protein
LSNQNTADVCLEEHTLPSVFKEDVKSPAKPSSPQVAISHDESLSFSPVGENSVDENCDIIYPTPKKTSLIKRKVFSGMGSPDVIHTTPLTESKEISLARQDKKLSKVGILKLGKQFSGKRNKQGISLIDFLDNACSADVSSRELRDQDTSACKKIKLNGFKSIFKEGSKFTHDANVQLFCEKSTVNKSIAKDLAHKDHTSVQDDTELNNLLQMPAAFLENSKNGHVTKADIKQCEHLNKAKQGTDVTVGTDTSNKIVCSDVLQLNSNCGSVRSSNNISGCDNRRGEDRNEESETGFNSAVLSKQAVFKESSFKSDLINLEARCSDFSVQSTDQCVGALYGNEQMTGGASAIQQVKVASGLSHMTEEDHTAWLSFDDSDFFMIKYMESE